MKRFLNRFLKQSPSYLKYIQAYFEEDGLLCPQCASVFEFQALTALTFVPCPSCGYANFVPMRLNDFLLFEPAGAGGMASVYKAYHRQHLGELFAVKVLSATHRDNLESVDAFVTEARLHGSIPPHPHVVSFVDSGCSEGRHYHAMKYVAGDRLVGRLEAEGKLPEPMALRLFEQTLAAIKHIYDHGVLYRDVNAANVIIDRQGDAVLLDFGLSLPVNEAARDKGKIAHVDGTAEYMPPERLRGQPEDQRSVIYSLGLMLFYMLTGELLVKGQTLTTTVRRHVSKLRLATGTSAPVSNVSDTAMDIVETMVQPEPVHRFQTFQDAYDAVEAALDEMDTG